MSIVRSDRLAYAADAIFQSPVVYWCVHPLREIADDADYFTPLARTGRLRAGDAISTCRYADDSRRRVIEEAMFRVLESGEDGVRVALLGEIVVHGAAAVPAPTETGLSVKWNGPTHRYAVIGPDGAVIEKGFARKEDAQAHLDSLKAAA